MPEGLEKLLRGPGSGTRAVGGLESRCEVPRERYEEGALHRVRTTRDLGQRKEIGGTQSMNRAGCSWRWGLAWEAYSRNLGLETE